MTHVSLFSGVGGIDLAAEWAGFRTIAQVELSSWRRRVLEKRFPGVPKWSYIEQFPDRDFGPVTLVSGGFPCPPYSSAGKRRGAKDPRHLWPEMARVIRQLKPAWVCAENVAGAVGLVLDQAIIDLEIEGYSVWPVVLPALAVGAWHERQRLFILAHLDSSRRGSPRIRMEQVSVARSKGKAEFVSGGTVGDSADVTGWRCKRRDLPAGSRPKGQGEADTMRSVADAPGPRQAVLVQRDTEAETEWRTEPRGREWWETERGLVRVVYGLPRWLDRHRRRRVAALGDSCSPAQVYPILRAIAEEERRGTVRLWREYAG